LELSGDKAQALLLKGCPLDLHHSVFSFGRCAQTVMAKTSMILWQTSDKPEYKLIVRRSFSDYLGLWLLDAAREFQE
jgi:sarcosine oxidase subunit gamma